MATKTKSRAKLIIEDPTNAFSGEPVPASPENARSFIRVSRMPHINSRLLNGAGYKNSIKIAHRPGPALPRNGPRMPSASKEEVRFRADDHTCITAFQPGL